MLSLLLWALILPWLTGAETTGFIDVDVSSPGAASSPAEGNDNVFSEIRSALSGFNTCEKCSICSECFDCVNIGGDLGNYTGIDDDGSALGCTSSASNSSFWTCVCKFEENDDYQDLIQLLGKNCGSSELTSAAVSAFGDVCTSLFLTPTASVPSLANTPTTVVTNSSLTSSISTSTVATPSITITQSSSVTSTSGNGALGSTSAPTSSPAPVSSGLSTGAKVGIGVGVGLGGLAVIAALFVLLGRPRKKPLEKAPETAIDTETPNPPPAPIEEAKPSPVSIEEFNPYPDATYVQH